MRGSILERQNILGERVVARQGGNKREAVSDGVVGEEGGALREACKRSDTFREGGLMDLPRCLVVIPARGGSKRVRDKNIRSFLGRPLLAYSLEVAREAGIFEHIHVSTESREVAGIARRWGYPPEFMRDVALADDTTGVWDVVRWVVERFRDRGEEYDCVCLLSACMPMLELDDLRGGLNYYIALGGRHVVMACCEYLSSPLRALSLGEGGEIIPRDLGLFNHPRSQELGNYVMDTGAFAFRSIGGLMGEIEEGGWRAFMLEREKGVDINTERDLEFAKVLYRGKFRGGE